MIILELVPKSGYFRTQKNLNDEKTGYYSRIGFDTLHPVSVYTLCIHLISI